jgi:hypothetical protein
MMNSLQNVPDEDHTTDAAPSAEWINLVSGESVAIGLGNGYALHGLVSDVSVDGSAVWIDLDAGRGRQMFCAADNVTITPTN